MQSPQLQALIPRLAHFDTQCYNGRFQKSREREFFHGDVVLYLWMRVMYQIEMGMETRAVVGLEGLSGAVGGNLRYLRWHRYVLNDWRNRRCVGRINPTIGCKADVKRNLRVWNERFFRLAQPSFAPSLGVSDYTDPQVRGTLNLMAIGS